VIRSEGANKLVQDQKDAKTGVLASTIVREVVDGKLVQVCNKKKKKKKNINK
jgi:hypothetical protein